MNESPSSLKNIPAPSAFNSIEIPKRIHASGARIPVIGLGTFGSDHASNAAISEAVRYAGEIGYRHFDCAEVYQNEREVGDALTYLQSRGIAREDLWITSKLWNNHHNPDDVIPACQESLRNLQLDYLDCYLIHWPFPNFHPPHCDVSSRSKDARPYNHESYMKTWRKMEKLVELGLVRYIGTSNMTIRKLKGLLEDCSIAPIVNEMELHPHFQQPELFRFVSDAGMIPIGFSPIGSPSRPERDRTPEDSIDIEDPVIKTIAQKHHIHPASVCVKWAVRRGQIPIPMSTNPRNLTANLQAVISEPLSEDEMQAIAGIDRNCRLIKGQVFLWEGASDWKVLWDE